MKYFFALLFLLFFSFFSFVAMAANDKSPGTSPTYKISVDAKLWSQFVDRGLSISNNNPALNAAFLFNLGPQFKFGFWGSNISNISASDDNFWFKFLGEVKIDFSSNSGMLLYLNDDHYYKSNVRNGQSAGIKLNYNLYTAQLEWMNNYQDSHTDAEYYNFGRLIDIGRNIKVGGNIGYTSQHANNYENYFDLKALANYQINSNAIIESAITTATNTEQFNGRANSAFYLAFELNF